MNEIDSLEAELREAREELVRKEQEAASGAHRPVYPERPATIRSVRLRALDRETLEEHVERLERDIADFERRDAMETLRDEADDCPTGD